MPFSSKLNFPYVGGGVVGFGVVVGISVGEEVGFGAIVELGEIIDLVAADDAFAVEVTTLGVAGWLDFNADVVWFLFSDFDARLWTLVAADDAFAVEVTTLGVAGWLDFNADVVWFLFSDFDARLWTDNIAEFDCFGAVVDLDELVGEGVGDTIIPWLSSTRWITFNSQQK